MKVLFLGPIIVGAVYSSLLETSVALVTFTGAVLSSRLPEIHLVSVPPSLLPFFPFSIMVGKSDFFFLLSFSFLRRRHLTCV